MNYSGKFHCTAADTLNFMAALHMCYLQIFSR